MPKHPTNHYRGWSAAEIKQLRALARAHTLARVIARKLKRTLFAVYSKMKHERIALAPARGRRAPGSTRVGR